MHIDLIDKIVHKNNGSFPMVDAKDVLINNVNDERLPDALNSKEDAMSIVSELPIDNALLPNTMYALDSLSGMVAISFVDGSSTDDMLYLSFTCGSELYLTFEGTNYLGIVLESDSLVQGNLLELIAIWNVASSKWLFTCRVFGT